LEDRNEKYGNNTLNRIENYGIMAMKEKIK